MAKYKCYLSEDEELTSIILRPTWKTRLGLYLTEIAKKLGIASTDRNLLEPESHLTQIEKTLKIGSKYGHNRIGPIKDRDGILFIYEKSKSDTI